MGTLLSAVWTGRPAYEQAFGRPFWEDLDSHPDIADSFDRLMGPDGHTACRRCLSTEGVLSDWPDREAPTFLRRCAEAAGPCGRIVVLNGVTPEDRASSLLMIALVGGKDRTLERPA